MDKETFNKLYQSLLRKARNVRDKKETEYFSESNVLRSFQRLGNFRNSNTPQAIMNLAGKHFQSLSDMVDAEFPKDPKKSPVELSSPELWDEKFIDSLNYTFKLYAAIKHERGEF